MPAKPVTIGSMDFARKGDAIIYFKEMLAKYSPGDRVSENDGEMLKHAIARHPEASEKIGIGIKDFSVRSGGFGTKCFWVNRLDGSTEDFSFRVCL
jgi:hypothetical protein